MKYYGTKNNKDYGFYEESFENSIEITDEVWHELLNAQNKGRRIVKIKDEIAAIDELEYDLKDGEWVKLSQEDAEIKKQKRQKEIAAYEIENELTELDKKRIRAIAEPSMKDENISWLEYYNQQVKELRQQLVNLTL